MASGHHHQWKPIKSEWIKSHLFAFWELPPMKKALIDFGAFLITASCLLFATFSLEGEPIK